LKTVERQAGRNERMGRQALAMWGPLSREAKLRQKEGGRKGGSSPGVTPAQHLYRLKNRSNPPGKVAGIIAERLGLHWVTAYRLRAVMVRLQELDRCGRTREAENLRALLDKSIDLAWRTMRNWAVRGSRRRTA
jgi:hypothetical protein